MSIHSLGKKRADRDYPAFVPSAARTVPGTVFVILDEDGDPIYSSRDRNSCHAHINFVINDSNDGAHVARHWIVREYRLHAA